MIRTRPAVGALLLALLAGCSSGAAAPAPTDPGGLGARWREQAAVRATDLIYPAAEYPMVGGPTDPEPTLYADAVRILADADDLDPRQRDHAVTLLTGWWPATPARNEDGFTWLALTRALGALDATDRLPADRLAPMLAWVRATLTGPGGRPRQVMVAARLARQVLDAGGAGQADLAHLLTRAATRLSCDRGTTVDEAVIAAVVAAAAKRPCVVTATVRAAAAARLASAGNEPGRQLDTVVGVAPLAGTAAVDRAAFAALAQRALRALGEPRYDRGGALGQSAVVTMADAMAEAGVEAALPANQIETLRRIVRSESRLADGIAQGDPLDTALAVDLLRRLGGPVPGPVTWRTEFTLLDRTILALAYDRRQLPAMARATAMVDARPPSTMAVGYLAAAYPGFCPKRATELRRALATTTDLAQQDGPRLMHTALLVATTAGCGGADQRRLTGTMVEALDRLGPSAAPNGPTGTIVDTWYRAEAGCLLGQLTRYLPDRAALRAAIARDVGLDQIRPTTTIAHLYAAVRLTDLVERPAACDSPWWRVRG